MTKQITNHNRYWDGRWVCANIRERFESLHYFPTLTFFFRLSYKERTKKFHLKQTANDVNRLLSTVKQNKTGCQCVSCFFLNRASAIRRRMTF